MTNLSHDLKFIDSIDIDPNEWDIETETGWEPITHLYKTIEYQEWKITTESNKFLICADTHILFDEYHNQIFTKDLIPYQSKILTIDGPELVTKIVCTNNFSNMYDITIDSENHAYYTNNILSHNTTTVLSHLLWLILFNDNQNILIAANKRQVAEDILEKLKTSYENIPTWLQQGVVEWNKGNIEIENGSKVRASSTTSGAARSGTYNCVLLDEFAHIQPRIATDFYTSVYPTITAGKTTKMFIVSCVTKDTLIFTNKGLRSLDDFIDHNQPHNGNIGYEVEPYQILGKDKLRAGNVVTNSGVSNTKKITSMFANLECAEDHKLYVNKDGHYDWYKAKELQIGDYIATQYNMNIWGNEDSLTDFIYHPNHKKGLESNQFIPPPNMTRNLAYFIGMFLAKGYARKYYKQNKLVGGQIVLFSGDDISECLNNLQIKWRKNNQFHYTINSKSLLLFLEYLGLDITKKSYEKLIPKKILSLSKANIQAFLSGYFKGNRTTHNLPNMLVVSSNPVLIEQIRMLLNNMGILSTHTSGTKPSTKYCEMPTTYYQIKLYSEKNPPNFLTDTLNQNIVWSQIKSIEDDQNELFDFALPDLQEDVWCHSIIYNGLIGHQTPKGMNLFYKFWVDALAKRNNFVPFEASWRDVPGRDQKWYDETLSNMDEQKFAQEYDCHFLGSSNTLINGMKLETMIQEDPLDKRGPLGNQVYIYERPIKETIDADTGKLITPEHKYVLVVDTSEGKKRDASAFSVIDITELPYRQVAVYKNNIIAPILYPSVINDIGRYYNTAYILVEIQSTGQQIVDILQTDLEYEAILRVGSGNKKSQQISATGGRGTYPGIKMSASVKRIGCSNLKTLIETDQLVIKDHETYQELTTFTLNSRGSYSADSPEDDDDIAMGLVMFAWLTTQKYFKESVAYDLRKKLQESYLNYTEEYDAPPTIQIDNGLNTPLINEDGVLWVEGNSSGGWMDPYNQWLENWKNNL